jgi:hypothetical protein
MDENGLSTTAGPEQALRLQLDPTTRISIGETAAIPVRVLNTSYLVTRAHMKVSPAEVAAWFAIPPPVAMYPLESAAVDLQVTLPLRPELQGSRVTFDVEVTAEPEGQVSVVEAALEISGGPAPPSPTAPRSPWVLEADTFPAPPPSPRRWLRPWRRRRPDTEGQPFPTLIDEDQQAMVVLSDQPVGRYEDELGFQQMAEQLAQIVLSPSTSTPFTVGIEGGWGSGKSTLMSLVEDALTSHAEGRTVGAAPVSVRTVRYNAWTAEGSSALSGLIRSVLPELDPSVLRRLVRRGRSSWWVGLTITVAMSFLGVGHLVDVAWRRFGVDKETRNEVRSQLFAAMDEWVHAGAAAGELRRLVVFVDDLDRCSPENIREVFEAIRVYLDAPGFVFVIGYDAAVVNDRLLNSADGAATPWRAYLEKIIQVDFHLPTPDADQLQRLARACARRSRATDLLGEEELALIAQRSDRNPRRLKRFLNAFVLARRLDVATAQLSPAEHIRVLLFQFYFPAFHRLLLDEDEPDPFADVHLLARAAAPGNEDDPTVRTALRELCGRRDVAPPSDDEPLEDTVRRLAPTLPPAIVELAGDRQFLTLVWKVGEEDERRSLLRGLRERPATLREVPPSPVVYACRVCGTENTMASPVCRRCGNLLWGGTPLGFVPPVPQPSQDLSLIGKFVILYDRTGGSYALAEGLSVRGAVVSVADTIRSVQVAVGRRPVLTVLVWVTHDAKTESAVAEQKRHLETVLDLVRSSVTKTPVVVWGPASSTLPRVWQADDTDVRVLFGGSTEESLAVALAHPGIWSPTPVSSD